MTVGRDPEISVPRPPNIRNMLLKFIGLPLYRPYFTAVIRHALGRMSGAEKTFIPESEFGKIYFRARIYLLIYAAVIGLSIYTRSILPLMFIGLPHLFGTWLMLIYGWTQHAGLAENVLDHRLNCRTVYMCAIHRYLYWNMNYHVEHHMFPLVPYHALPRLHEAVKGDMPTPYPSLLSAWREIVPSVLKQVKDPAYYVRRKLPPPQSRIVAENKGLSQQAIPDAEGWVKVCSAADLIPQDAIRFDHGKKTFALYRDEANRLYATDGICTHGNTHLANGLVKGTQIECPKHNGRFNLADGSPARAPVCRGLATFPIEERDGSLWLNIVRAGGAGERSQRTWSLRVVSSRSVATFIRELVFETESGPSIDFRPGDYLQFDIPTYDTIRFRDFDIPQPYASVWERQHVFDLIAQNPGQVDRRNNYSIAANPVTEGSLLRFNVRIATPPPGQDCLPGIGSAYMFSLKPGDHVTAIGPFGDFHIKPTQREMVYVGGGAGMAPLRCHISHLFETEQTHRKVSYWYGARSRQEIFYSDYFQALAAKHSNFTFQTALSTPLEEDDWTGHTGFIHEVLLQQYLQNHSNPGAVEYYLCGPPMMIKACTKMLAGLNVPTSNIAYDEF
ncbi:MAG: NADH:ubiquinone reductase (Na(+)-transporting) subunit F [Phycisphaerales bacterium]|jgi:MocE subfamily Rieske [2Fe-2S] domain protein|nr:NADH:ubiquinone reductase (Na(+)-transporting) subunit F [Phycisphaerales bacterium]